MARESASAQVIEQVPSTQVTEVAEESTERPMEIAPGVAVRVGGVAGVATSFPEDGKVIVETEDGKILPYDESEVEVVGETTETTGTTETTMSDGSNESAEVDDNGRPFIVSSNGTTTFGEITEDTGLPSAPIKLSEGYQDENGKGYGLAHIEANYGKQIRGAGFKSVEEFVRFVAENYDGNDIRVGNPRGDGNITYLIQVKDKYDNTLFIELSRDGSYWNVNSGGVFRKGYSDKKETVVKTEPQQPNNAVSPDSSLSEVGNEGISTTEPNGESPVSQGEDSENKSDMQEGGVNSQAIPVDAKGEPMYESAPVEATIADIYNDPDLDEEEADAFVQAKIDGATKRIAQLEKKKPKMGESKVAFKEAKAKWREQLEAEQASLAYWQGVQEARAKESTASPLTPQSYGQPPYQSRGAITPPIAAQPGGELDTNGEMGEIGEMSAEAEGDDVSERDSKVDKGTNVAEEGSVTEGTVEEETPIVEEQTQEETGELTTSPLQDSAQSQASGGLSEDLAEVVGETDRLLAEKGRAMEAYLRAEEESDRKAKFADNLQAVIALETYAMGLSDEQLAALQTHYGKGEVREIDDEISRREANKGKSTQYDELLSKQYPIERKARKGTGKLEDALSKDVTRPVMTGVYHDEDGYAVATDAKVLVADKREYNGRKKGKIIGKDGKEIPGNYPKWKLAIPAETEALPIDLQDLSGFIGGVKAKLKENGIKPKDYGKAVVMIKTGSGTIVYYPVDALETWLNGAMRLGATGSDVGVSERNGFIVAKTKNGVAMLASKGGLAYNDTGIVYEVNPSPSTPQSQGDSSPALRGALEMQVGDGVMENATDAQRLATEAVITSLEASGIEVVEASDAMAEAVMGMGGSTHEIELQAVNDKFNAELQQQIDGTLPKGHVYSLGYPSAILRSAGLPNLPIELASSRLSDKSMQENHPFELSEIEGLVNAIQNPLAVFRSATHIGSYVVLTEIEHKGKNFVVAIEANRKQGRLEVNSVRSIHYRSSNTHIANWIKDDLMEYADKKRMSEWISKQRYNSADVRNLFRHVAKVVQNFENPKIEAQIVYHGSGAKFDAFDHSHMGQGEGAQAYGWGTYVTEVEGIGKQYANTMRDKAITDKHRENAIINNLARQVLASNNGNKAEILEYLRGLLNESWSDKKRVRAQIKIIEIGKFLPETKIKAQLYTVEIPEDNGSNYLYHDKVMANNVIADVKRRLYDILSQGQYKGAERELREELDEVFVSGLEGDVLYNNVSAYLGGDKQASQLFNEMGFVGIKYPAQYTTGGRTDGKSNYVIFNEADAKITSRVEFLKTPQGVVYGWTDGKKVYLTKEGMNPETPIHEYTHLWARAMMQGNAEGWQSVKDLLRGTPIWNEVMSDANYADIHGDEDAVASECLARLSGKENAKRMEAEARKMIDEAKGVFAKADAVTLVERMKKALQEFWNWVGKNLFDIKSFGSIEEVTDRVLYDLIHNSQFIIHNSELPGIEKQIIGERGASALDKADEATHRMDNLGVAREMEADGKDAKAIRMATGWERGADGKWRYEIEDYSIKEEKIDFITNQLDYKNTATIILKDLLEDAQGLFAAYPELRNMRVVIKKDSSVIGQGELQWYDAVYDRQIVLNETAIISHFAKSALERYGKADVGIIRIKQGYDPTTKEKFTNEADKQEALKTYIEMMNEALLDYHRFKSKNKDIATSILTHEIQHAIQFIEGFARGSSPKEFADVRGAVIDSIDFMTNGDLLKGNSISNSQSLRDALNKKIPYTNISLKEGYIDNLQKVARKYGYDNIDALVDDFEKMPSAFEQYHRTAGEVEARNASARMGMSADERRATLLSETEDVAREDQIFLMENSGVSAMAEGEINDLISQMKANASVEPIVEISEENWVDKIVTPIGEVKMGEHQKSKLFNKGREKQYGMLLETLSNPDIVLEEQSKEDTTHERDSVYLFIKTFQKEDGSKYVHFESVTVKQDGLEVSISSHIIRENQLRNKMKSDRLLYKATALDQSTNSSAEQSIKGGSLSSTDKGSDNIGDVQGLEDYSAEEIKEIARGYIEDVIAENGFDAEVVDLAIYGSRRRGDARDDSDLDIVVEYSGNAREDDLFNALNDAETQLEIDGVKVDINPITKSKSGTLGEFMERVREYDEGNGSNGSTKKSQPLTNPSAFGTSPKTGEESGGSLEDDGLLFREGDGEMNDAEVSMANDPIAKIMGKSQRSKKQQAKFAERERKYMRNTNELGEKIAEAESEVNTNPTDKQKEAGNYKKGHVKVGPFNITIEQPKGSVRRGVDADGNKWETEMQNTYGYIRGTEGVDGDHIDVFLSDDIDGWDGHKVFVVDQRNADGSFDEHKVMLGFNDINDAEAAYMSNYEEGWQGLGAITGVAIEEFGKWIASSHRKTKAFAEYKSVKTTEGQSTDEGILFRDGESDGTREEYDRRVRRPNRSGSVGKWDNLGWRMKEAYQDSMLSLKELQEVIAKKYGLQEIPSWMNAYLQENLMSSRNKAASDVYMRDFYNPMMKEVQALIKKGVKYEDLVNYMIAKHGLERNVVMAERDAKRAADEAKEKGEDWQKAYDEALKENRKRDYSGLTALTGEESVVDAEKVAEKMALAKCDYDTTFSPMIEAKSVKMKNKRRKFVGSLKTKMPIRAVPSAPMPVQMA